MLRGHVLVVDDETSILNTLKKALSLEGYQVDLAGGIAVAEERLAKHTYDAVLLDVALPDGDGLDLLARLRGAGNESAVLMMSGHATIDAAVRATKLGALDFLEKPLSTDRLLSCSKMPSVCCTQRRRPASCTLKPAISMNWWEIAG